MPDVAFQAIVAGRGEMSAPAGVQVGRPTGTVRYADPLARLAAAAADKASASLADTLATMSDDIGVVTVSNHGPRSTMLLVAVDSNLGVASPLKFAAANPGSPVAVICTTRGFHGPTLNLTMRAEIGAPLALDLASLWLRREAVRGVVIAVLHADEKALTARAVLLLRDAPPGVDRRDDLYAIRRWLMMET